jgi:Zn-finger nucleic acid-binding protein
MRHLVLCSRCHRQLDAGERAAGERLLCACGESVEVPALEAHDSAVVRCSACGAPREGEEPECRYCGSSFTVHELDIDTICPGCMARVSGSARFCSHCGCPILVGQAAVGAASLHCPACGPGQQLASRRLGAEPVAVAECARCGGLWLGQLESAALAPAAAGRGAGGAAAAVGAAGWAKAPGAEVAAGGGGRLYRPCAVCGALMNRQNYGRKSGAILDICRAHGIWFDLGELPRVLDWIRDGGEQRAGELAAEEAQDQARQRRLGQEAASALGGGGWLRPAHDPDFYGDLIELVGEGLGRLFHRA